MQANLVTAAEEAGHPVSSVAAQVDALQKQIDAAIVNRDKAKAAQKSMENLWGERVAKLIDSGRPDSVQRSAA